MCVDTKNYAWERPATKSDCAIIASHFPGMDYEGLLNAMSKDEARPLTAHLVMLGAAIHAPMDEFGLQSVPFSVIETEKSTNTVQLPVMDQIVEWFENAAQGTEMWKNASDFCEARDGFRVHFGHNCDCHIVPVSAYADGTYSEAVRSFNRSRAHLFGRTTAVRRDTNSVEGLDITAAQLMLWHRIRQCIEALPAEATSEVRLAA